MLHFCSGIQPARLLFSVTVLITLVSFIGVSPLIGYIELIAVTGAIARNQLQKYFITPAYHALFP